MSKKNGPLDDELVLYRVDDLPKVTNDAISARQGRRYIAEGRITVVKPAGKFGPAYIRRADLLKFLRDNTVPATR